MLKQITNSESGESTTDHFRIVSNMQFCLFDHFFQRQRKLWVYLEFKKDKRHRIRFQLTTCIVFTITVLKPTSNLTSVSFACMLLAKIQMQQSSPCRPQSTELKWMPIEFAHWMWSLNEIRLKRTIIIFKWCNMRLMYSCSSTAAVVVRSSHRCCVNPNRPSLLLEFQSIWMPLNRSIRVAILIVPGSADS